MDEVLTGSIIQLLSNWDTGYTFGGKIYCDQTGKSYFFHKNELDNCNIRILEEGDVVEFRIGENDRGPCAVSVRKKYQSAKTAQEAVKITPGQHQNVELTHFNSDEIEIIKRLREALYITNGGGEFKINDSKYRYCLIKPTDDFRHMFQISREVIVVFSDYIAFEPRSLDAASYVHQHSREPLRLEKGFHILICHDDTVEEQLNVYLKDNAVNQIVVPFTYRELLGLKVNHDTVKEFITERFRKYLFDTDLFAVSTPIKDELFFFGRRDYVNDIVAKCKNSTHSGIFGLRRSGKTSMLYAVQKILEQQQYPTVLIPCESDLSSLGWKTALCKVILDVYKALEIDASKIDEGDYNSENATTYFEEDLDFALKGLSVPLTIMFDEIEAITFGVHYGENSENIWYDGHNFIKFWNTIKGYYTKNPRKVSILVAGTNPMINEASKIGEANLDNPMFRQLSEANQGTYLPAFSYEDTRNMVNTLGGYMGLKFDDYSVSQLVNDCGGHPYLMRIMCSFINKAVREDKMPRPGVVKKATFDKAEPKFEQSNEATGFFMMILNILTTSYPQEYQTLKILALSGDDIVSQIASQESLSHLIGYGLVECNNNNYAIKYSTITRFLRGEYKFERQGLSIEEQKNEISLRINDAEMKLRRLVKNQLKSSFGAQTAKERVLETMSMNRSISDRDYEKAERLSFKQLFDTSVNKMYVSILMGIILDNFDVFSKMFEPAGQNDVRQNLTVINSSRRCPDHSYDKDAENWSYDDFLQFRSAMNWLEEILADYE